MVEHVRFLTMLVGCTSWSRGYRMPCNPALCRYRYHCRPSAAGLDSSNKVVGSCSYEDKHHEATLTLLWTYLARFVHA